MQRILTIFLLLITGSLAPAVAVDAPRVMVGIAPIHSLVAGVMDGVAEPELLVKGNHSPHGYMLKPSQLRSLQQADMIVWTGESIESFLPRVLVNLDDNKSIIKLMDVAGMTLLPAREGGVWQSGHEEHAHGDSDGHLWLDPGNAKIIVTLLVERLSRMDAQHAVTYRANGVRMQQALTELDQQLKQKLVKVKHIPYLVFHDAYQYFEHAYGLNPVGAVMIDPDHKPGARRLTELRENVRASNIRCVFSEPQYSENLVKVVTEGTAMHSARLDPMGMSLEPGKELYFDLLTGLGDSLLGCLETGFDHDQ